MRTLAIISGLMLAGSTFAADLGTPTDVAARFMFVPSGFDNNDQVQVTLDGYLPNACYKITEPRVDFDSGLKTYTVTAVALKFDADESVCGTYQVPYTVTATLGQVSEGDYVISTLGADKKNLHVKASSTVGPDDYLYAPVDHTHVSVDLSRREIIASIEGRFTNSCMRFQEVKTLDEGENIVLLPIITMADRTDCHPQDMRYKAMEVKLPWRQPGRYLLTVRGLSGVAVNNVFEVDSVR
jgi:hypothetical protein